jgi:hypothetical protein
MNTKSLTQAAALSALVFLASNALADGPRPALPNTPSSSVKSTPWRVHVPRSSHNGESIDYSVDPQYHTATFHTVTHDRRPTSEPDRIFDITKRMFVSNPAYHEPAAAKPVVQMKGASFEPRRMYDMEKGQFVDNPDYHEPQTARTATANSRVTQIQGGGPRPLAHRTSKRSVVHQPAA